MDYISNFISQYGALFAQGTVDTIVMVLASTIGAYVIGIILGMTGYSIIWPLFGAANQLLAALALLAVCAWLGNAGRNNKMFFVPMAFMLLATLTSLAITFYQKVTTIMTSGIALAPVLQAILAVLLFVLAVWYMVKML